MEKSVAANRQRQNVEREKKLTRIFQKTPTEKLYGDQAVKGFVEISIHFYNH